MFIVVPRLSEIPAIYGIYSVVVSFSIFFAYADMGFFGAGFKYASESFAKGNREEEIEVTGFICFLTLSFVAFCAAWFFYFALKPQILFRDLSAPNDIRIASHLLITLASFSPVIVLQRLLQIIYGVRIEAFVNQRVQTSASVLKILSVFYFFQDGKFDIVGYFIFFQCMNLLGGIVSAFIAKKRYAYDFTFFLNSFKFSISMYRKTKKLALSSLYIAATHIIYYELDMFAIGKLLGAEKVALYAIGFTFQSFVRSLFGVFFSPFSARFNHFIGLKDKDGLQSFLRSVIILTLPLVVFPVISMTLLMKPLIFCWVGNDYASSITIAQFLVLGFLYNFISAPIGSVLIAHENLRLLYITGSILPVVYWTGVLATTGMLGVESFALNKFISITVVNVLFFVIAVRLLKISMWRFFSDIIGPIVIPCIGLTAILFYLSPHLPASKDKFGLMIVISSGALASLLALFVYTIFSVTFRNYVLGVARKATFALKRVRIN